MAYGDERGAQQNRVSYAQNRYNQQQGPMVNAFAENYGRGSEANYGDYTDIMNRYRDIAGGGGAGGGGIGGAGYSPSLAGYNDPFKSYAGYEEFSKTGGYSPQDIANMRARGVSPIRAAYANAQQNVQRQRSLQGGYAPNAIAAQVKMAREQGQSAADATQNVEAGLAEARNKGRLAGLGGMSGIEGQRLGADVDISKFNASAQNQAAAFGASASNSASQANRAAQLQALSGMTSLYGTNPGMSETFGNQLLSGVGQGGQVNQGYVNSAYQGAGLPSAWDTWSNRAGQVSNTAAPWLDYFGNRRTQTGGNNGRSGTYGTGGTYGGGYIGE